MKSLLTKLICTTEVAQKNRKDYQKDGASQPEHVIPLRSLNTLSAARSTQNALW